MDHKIKGALPVTVYFNKMISAAQRSDAALRLRLVDRLIAVQPAQHCLIAEPVVCLSDRPADGNIVAYDGVQFLALHAFCPDPCDRHAASDIHADKVRHQRLPHSHGQPDRSHLARMHVRHHADPAARGTGVVADHLQLFPCVVIDGTLLVVCRVHERVCVFSKYCNHKNSFYIIILYKSLC